MPDYYFFHIISFLYNSIFFLHIIAPKSIISFTYVFSLAFMHRYYQIIIRAIQTAKAIYQSLSATIIISDSIWKIVLYTWKKLYYCTKSMIYIYVSLCKFCFYLKTLFHHSFLSYFPFFLSNKQNISITVTCGCVKISYT